MPPCIEVSNLYKVYNRGKAHILDNVSLQINSGEIFGLIGPNGAGKTTLMSCMLALVMPTNGTIKINGYDPADLDIRYMSAFLPERPHFDAWMTVGQFLHYHHELAGLPPKQAEANISRVLERVELEPTVKKQRVRKLSRGMLQRLGLAQVLLGNPTICFLDEPASGMDPLGVQLVRQLLLEWKANGTTVVLNSHHLDQVEKTCDRIAFMKDGKIRSIEGLTFNKQEEHHLIIKWCLSSNIENIEEILGRTATNLKTTYVAGNDNSAKFSLNECALPHKIISELIGQGVLIQEAVTEKHSLEDLFRELTANFKEDAPK